ncbi:Nuclear pore complex nucleoporin component [Marasmius sp. AFHP31]|nr:Nuclear pore complex nucleoporin component [Marasmius sp. AFHP31]
MRFSAPRSLSPSPVRKQVSSLLPKARIKSPKKHSKQPHAPVTPPRRHTSTFGLNSDDEDDYDIDEDESSDSYDTESGSSSDVDSVPSSDSDSDSFCYGSESEVPPPPPRTQLLASSRTTKEQRYVEDTISAIRLRARHYDPYEEWEKEMRKESLRTARKEHESSQSRLHATQEEHLVKETARLSVLHAKEQSDVNAALENFRLQYQQVEAKMREGLENRNKFLWDRVEKGIKLDQERAQAKWDEERRIKEAEEKRRREEEERQRIEETQRRLEAEKKKREEEEARQKKEEEERKEREDKERREKEARERAERLKAEESSRKQTGMTTPEEDWAKARGNLNIAKSQGTRVVKNDKAMKSIYLAGRRQIIPKVGQLTNDAEAIARVSAQLMQILVPNVGTHPPPVYTALLSALAKAFILQAETEVTAEKRSVEPLAQVAFNCLETLQGFPEVFFAKIVQRVGGWAIPVYVLPPTDHDGRPWTNAAEKKKVMGYREGESETEYSDRVMGVMRLYFAILKIVPKRGPLGGMWQMTRVWAWMARVVSDRVLLETPVGVGVLHVALETLGVDARQIWGAQFVKLLSLFYEGATKGLGNGKLMGGETPSGIAARSRVRFEIENIMTGSDGGRLAAPQPGRFNSPVDPGFIAGRR